ncbi:hypothetical protein AB0H82_24140 [Streptomyces sp. NPDC050732]|uniref:hypothetical protein n=1 Tax=Streptomyces sp. NPDC050732 TaxID=3154632 RepID=UPI00344083AE
MSEQQRHGGEEPTWDSLGTKGKILAAVGITGLGVGVAALVLLFLLLMVLIVTAAFSDSIEFDGPGTLLWAALLCLPCGLLAGVFTAPVRFLLRLNQPARRTRQAVEAVASCLTTFLAALFVLEFTPGLHATDPYLPAAGATVLGIAADLVVERAESRRRQRPRERQGR